MVSNFTYLVQFSSHILSPVASTFRGCLLFVILFMLNGFQCKGFRAIIHRQIYKNRKVRRLCPVYNLIENKDHRQGTIVQTPGNTTMHLISVSFKGEFQILEYFF
jgi:hypothetical protein